MDDTLKHWGILGMKWGIRRFQNQDGSLTPEGRVRYGVGPAKNITGNVLGINDAGSLSDEELRKMARRYQNQADYYRARNNYIYEEKRYKENTAPKQRPKKEHTFLKNVFGRPLENFLAQNVQFGMGALGYGLLKTDNPDMAAQYLKSVTGLDIHYKSSKDKEKQKLQEEYDLLKLKNNLESEKRKKENPNYYDNDWDKLNKRGQNYQKFIDAQKKDASRLDNKIEHLADFMNTNTRDYREARDEVDQLMKEYYFKYGNNVPDYYPDWDSHYKNNENQAGRRR